MAKEVQEAKGDYLVVDILRPANRHGNLKIRKKTNAHR